MIEETRGGIPRTADRPYSPRRLSLPSSTSPLLTLIRRRDETHDLPPGPRPFGWDEGNHRKAKRHVPLDTALTVHWTLFHGIKVWLQKIVIAIVVGVSAGWKERCSFSRMAPIIARERLKMLGRGRTDRPIGNISSAEPGSGDELLAGRLRWLYSF